MEEKTGVSLSFLTSEDIARLAFVEVKVRCGQEDRAAPWTPVIQRGVEYATFYDTRMGNFDARTFPSQACSTCCSSMNGRFGNERCQGHFGYISMPRRYPSDAARAGERICVINPHLSSEVEQLLQSECFFCHKFRATDFDVERSRQALRLVDAGLVGEALHFLEVVANSRGQERRNRSRRDPDEIVLNDVPLMVEYVDRIIASKASATEDELAGPEGATRRSVMDVRNTICRQVVRELREWSYVCSHCGGISPRITSKNGHLFFFFRKKNADYNVAQGGLTEAQLRQWDIINQRQGRSHTYYRTSWVREHIKQLCHREGPLLAAIYPHLGEPTVSMPYACPLPPQYMYRAFFLDKLLVPPLPLRLSSGAQVSESGVLAPDDHTRALSEILAFVEQIETYYLLANNSTTEKNLISNAQEVAHELNLQNLQGKVAEMYSSVLDSFAKKEGLFRMHMMGKRVNQACRSVISPDYMLEPNEALLPRPFARSLTFPEAVCTVSPARVQFLKRCVVNGPDVYPGATHIEIVTASGETRFVDLHVPETVRRQHAMKYFAMSQTGSLVVHRHIVDGDRLIFNRQPTLHKASMMGYRAKVLSGLKTLRFHYVNGKSYNADFDGDEMNIHVPQSLEAKAELECIMDANMNFLVPTSGKPIRGCIQDHIVAGVLLTLRDKFLDHGEFVQCVYNGIAPYMMKHGNPLAAHATLTELIPCPAILKPRPLWTGKQVVSVLVHYVTGVVESRQGKPKSHGASVHGTSLIQPNTYSTTDPMSGELINPTRKAMDDDHVHFLQSELVTGVLCKNQLGSGNLSITHVIHEIYGPHMVGELFGALGRVLTMSLQREGFSIGIDDTLLVQEDRRQQLLRELDNSALHLPDDEAKVMPVIMGLATKLQKEFVPGRMLLPFPKNQLLMMTMSGAKGSNTNAIQMALGLGQQLFDGRRVARMNSGKTMPSFFAGEKRARAFGYAMGRFASGIRPAEYTIHAMAGRDGLIDTAVKTSRSGHLQRCLIKGLESLSIHWDHSVRDANGSVVQFLYGGDGLDPMRTSSLAAWEMVKDNVVDLGRKMQVDTGVVDADDEELQQRNVHGKRDRIDELVAAQKAAQSAMLVEEVNRDPLPQVYKDKLSAYLNNKASFPLFKKVSQVARWAQSGSLAAKLSEKKKENVDYYTDVMTEVTARRRVRAYCDPGEPVGLLAAQAAGEPSTQMTLNTFHSAGSTVTHVTEGIPRLRELLIYASVAKAAIVVPVEKATEADEDAISRILLAGVSTRLTDCMARVPASAAAGRGATSGYHFNVVRGEDGTRVTVALLFSKTLLQQKQEAMCMSPSEHLQSFMATLKNFAKQVVTTLRGRSSAGKDGDEEKPMHEAVQDPSQLANDDDEDLGSDMGQSREDEGEDRSTRNGTPALGAATPSALPRTAPKVKKNGFRLDGESDAEESGEGSDSDSESNVGGDDQPLAGLYKRKQREAVEEEEDEESVADVPLAGREVSYDTFPRINASLGNSKYRVEIGPLIRSALARDTTVKLPDDFFIVNVMICTAEPLVAVIPDVLESALQQQTFPSWLRQFDSVSFTRKAEDPSSGEMVFQGPSASIRNVTAFLSLFTVGCRAIKVRKARSTDIRDMVTSLGVESGYKCLFDELDKLFRRYAVDYHHLTLIADAATHRGVWENFNFTGVVAHSASPLFQMTFASSKKFLHTALTRGVGDDLTSISSAIMVGARPHVGTAAVKVMQDPRILRDVVERNLVTA